MSDFQPDELVNITAERAVTDTEPPAAAPTVPERLTEEPPTGSVVAINWRSPHQEIWVSNQSNIGNWYTTDAPFLPQHPTWGDVLRRAEGCTLTLLVAADEDTYRVGYCAGVDATAEAVTDAIEEARHA